MYRPMPALAKSRVNRDKRTLSLVFHGLRAVAPTVYGVNGDMLEIGK